MLRRTAAAVLLAAVWTPLAAQTPAARAARLVRVMMPEERLALVVRFPLEIAPMPGASKAIPCAEKAARLEGRPFFARLYTSMLTPDEMTAAADFFSTTEGKAVVRIERENLARVFALAKAGQQVDDENPHYPADVQAALDRFKATPTGAKFYDIWQSETPEAKERFQSFSGDITQRCLVSAAKK